MDSVYIETSIVSHASAWPSSNPATAVLQDQAKRWLTEEASKYDLVTSQFYDLLDDLGFPRLLICTPAEFLGDPDNGS